MHHRALVSPELTRPTVRHVPGPESKEYAVRGRLHQPVERDVETLRPDPSSTREAQLRTYADTSPSRDNLLMRAIGDREYVVKGRRHNNVSPSSTPEPQDLSHLPRVLHASPGQDRESQLRRIEEHDCAFDRMMTKGQWPVHARRSPSPQASSGGTAIAVESDPVVGHSVIGFPGMSKVAPMKPTGRVHATEDVQIPFAGRGGASSPSPVCGLRTFKTERGKLPQIG
eukprot:PhM_4_TR1269/c0_g10_i2/m.31620